MSTILDKRLPHRTLRSVSPERLNPEPSTLRRILYHFPTSDSPFLRPVLSHDMRVDRPPRVRGCMLAFALLRRPHRRGRPYLKIANLDTIVMYRGIDWTLLCTAVDIFPSYPGPLPADSTNRCLFRAAPGNLIGTEYNDRLPDGVLRGCAAASPIS